MKYLTIDWDDFVYLQEELREFSLLDEVIISVNDSDFSGRSIEEFIKNCPGARITQTPEDVLLEECADWSNKFMNDFR